ncbi:MAG TPA: S49 family peptidase [Pseudonocardia sp.]|nr:S49 family peptidase [Pseudonocardia sp.]
MRIPDRLAARLPGRLGERSDRPVVSMVRLHGVITPTPPPVPRSVINAAALDKVLERAFAPDRLAAVALLVNSPGGSATQSALVADRIRRLADDRGVPVLAFCEDVAASGGYWLACAADEIHAHPTSLVGSIGVISAGFGLEGLIQRIGVERRLHTAGESKSRLDPFLPEKGEDVAWLRGLQDQLHAMFREWVTSRRGERLRGGDELFDGEVWTGARALELGLVDGLGTARGVLAERFPGAEPTLVEGRKPLFARLGMGQAPARAGLGADLLLDLVQAAEMRATWARYGL